MTIWRTICLSAAVSWLSTSLALAKTIDTTNSEDTVQAQSRYVLQQDPDKDAIFKFLDSSGDLFGEIAEPPVGVSIYGKSGLDRRTGDKRLLNWRLTDQLHLPFYDGTYAEYGVAKAYPQDMVYLEETHSIYVCYFGTPAAIAKLSNIDDGTPTVQLVTFANDGLHRDCRDIVYVPGTKLLYATFFGFGSGKIPISSIDPVTMAINDADISGTDGTGAIVSLTTDGTYLYRCDDDTTNSTIYKILASDLSLVDSSAMGTSYPNCNAIAYDGTNLIAATRSASAPKLVKIDPSDLSVIGSVDLSGVPAGQDNVVLGPGYAYVGFYTGPDRGKVARVDTEAMAVKDVINFGLDDAAPSSNGMLFDGRYVWVALGYAPPSGSHGALVRFDPWTRESLRYLDDGSELDLQDVFAMTTDGRGRLWLAAGASVPSKIIRIGELSGASVFMRHPTDTSDAIYSDADSWSISNMAVDASVCTKTSAAIGDGPTVDVIHCSDLAGGTIEGSGNLPTQYLPINVGASDVTFQLELNVFSDQSSGLLEFDGSCGCAGPGEAVPAYGTSAPFQIMFTAADKRSSVEVNLVCDGPGGAGDCEADDWYFWKLALDDTATSATLTGTYVLGVDVKYPISGMGDALQ